MTCRRVPQKPDSVRDGRQLMNLGVRISVSRAKMEHAAAHPGDSWRQALREPVIGFNQDYWQKFLDHAWDDAVEHVHGSCACPAGHGRLQWYPNTPVGFNLVKGTTLDEVADEALRGDPASPGAGRERTPQ